MADLDRGAEPASWTFKLSAGSFHKLSALLTLALLIFAFSFGNAAFFSINNGLTVLLQTSVIGLLGIGMTMVIITGGIDLSVGSVLALSGTITGLSIKAGVPVGLMLIARGVALQLTGAAPISRLGESFGLLGNGSLFRIVEKTGGIFPKVVFPGIPYPVILLAVVALAAAYLLRRRQIGRHIYATGSNEEAARLSGVLVDRTKIFAYVLSGALAGLAGNVLMSRLVTVQPNEGVMYELDAIAAAVIGGASLMGGVGNISGTMIGAVIIGVLRNGLNMAGVSAFIQQIVIGVIVILAVYVDQIRNRR